MTGLWAVIDASLEASEGEAGLGWKEEGLWWKRKKLQAEIQSESTRGYPRGLCGHRCRETPA